MSDGCDWRTEAACQAHHADMWFPDPKSRRLHERTLDLARLVCAGCPVRAQCLAACIGEEFGIWAGTSEQERRAMRRRAGIRRTGSEVIKLRFLDVS